MLDRLHEFRDECISRRTVLCPTRQFEIEWIERAGSGRMARHAVSDTGVVDEIAGILASSFDRLTSSEFGWTLPTPPAGDTAPIWRVALKDLGPKIFGAAIASNLRHASHTSSLVLNVRALEPNRQSAYSRRKATVAHELCHLLQFETETFRYWPRRGRAGLADPNWWLHEATAVAAEAELCRDSPECYSMYWDWATTPFRSLESDGSGSLAAPFLSYLVRILPTGTRFLSEIYATEPDLIAGMSGTELLNAVLQLYGKQLSAVDGAEFFASGYCADAAFVGTDSSLQDPRICEVVGPRLISEIYDRFPVEPHDCPQRVDHLGCCYLQFRCPPRCRQLEINVQPQSPVGFQCLRAELLLADPDGRKIGQKTLDRIVPERRLATRCEISSCQSAVLVVVNCAHGADARQFDGQGFSLSAAVK